MNILLYATLCLAMCGCDLAPPGGGLENNLAYLKTQVTNLKERDTSLAARVQKLEAEVKRLGEREAKRSGRYK